MSFDEATLQADNRKINEQFVAKLNRLLGDFRARPARFRGFEEGSIWYCWNTEPLSGEPRPWAAWKYRRNKEKGTWKQVGKTVYFASRHKAKARAHKWHKKAVDHRVFRDFKKRYRPSQGTTELKEPNYSGAGNL